MAHNNDALYDAVVAGAGGGAQHGWLVLSTPASYTPFATNIDILATAVDLQIPTIAGGPSISQINLLQSITQSVLTARFPVPVAPATYIDIAKLCLGMITPPNKLPFPMLPSAGHLGFSRFNRSPTPNSPLPVPQRSTLPLFDGKLVL